MIPKTDPEGSLVDHIVLKVLESPKYAKISEEFIRHITLQELEKRGKEREVLKAVKNKLHQVGGAYLEHPVNYTRCMQELTEAYQQNANAFRNTCKQMMCYHSSTRERLPEIDRFYQTILGELKPIYKLIDIACGLNPLAIPWMDLPKGVEYTAVDIYEDMIHFLSNFFDLIHMEGIAITKDMIGQYLPWKGDVALVLKTIPCLEQVEKRVGEQLLDRLQANHVVVSFPVKSLGGRRDKGMIENYTNRFNEIIQARRWPVKRYEFQTELVFVVNKSE